MSKLLDKIINYIAVKGIFADANNNVTLPNNLVIPGSCTISNGATQVNITGGDIILPNNHVIKGTWANGTTTSNLIGMSTSNVVSLGWNSPYGINFHTNANAHTVSINNGKISGLDADISLLGQNDAATVEYVSNRLVQHGKGVTLFASSDGSLSAQTDTNVKFNTVISGTYQWNFSTATAPTSTGVTELISGKYLISGAVQFAGVSNTAFTGRVTLHVGTSFNIENYNISTAGANVSVVIPPTFVEVPSGTTYNVYLTAYASVATSYRGGNSTGRTYMTMQRL